MCGQGIGKSARATEYCASVFTDCPRCWLFVKHKIQPDAGWSLPHLLQSIKLSSALFLPEIPNEIHHLVFHFPPPGNLVPAGQNIPFATHLAYAQYLLAKNLAEEIRITYECLIQIPGIISPFTVEHYITKTAGGYCRNGNTVLPLVWYDYAEELLRPYMLQGILPSRPKAYHKEYPTPCRRGFCPWYYVCEIVHEENVRELSVIKTWRLQ
jgi:hypothetical protein